MKAHRVCFNEPRSAVLEEFELDERLADRQALVKTECSIISAGTEGASYSGLEEEHPGRSGPFTYPRYTGYGNLGEIIALGPNCSDLKVGDRVLSFSPHASHVKVDTGRFALRVPPNLDGKRAVFTRMAGVSITSTRSSSVSLGDSVAVIGMGLVGNFAAQLFQLSGAKVIAIDISPFRLGVASSCGIEHAVNPSQVDLRQAIMDKTEGKGVQVCVEAIGKSELIAQAVEITRRKGEVILLGSPRARVSMDVTPMLSRIHLQGIRMIGALEWLYSVPETDAAKQSITENYRQILRWVESGRLKTEPLLTHLLSPAECQLAYGGLHSRKDEFLGVVFDWKGWKRV